MSNKIRLYRGPANGKIYHSPDLPPVLTMATSHAHGFDNFDNTGPFQPLALKTHYYYKTNHSHPDGSVYYEWEHKRGTPIK